VLAEPDMLAKVVSFSSGVPRYPASGPVRTELLAAIDDFLNGIPVA
jgi:hypothetical protein